MIRSTRWPVLKVRWRTPENSCRSCQTRRCPFITVGYRPTGCWRALSPLSLRCLISDIWLLRSATPTYYDKEPSKTCRVECFSIPFSCNRSDRHDRTDRVNGGRPLLRIAQASSHSTLILLRRYSYSITYALPLECPPLHFPTQHTTLGPNTKE
jgi:hypothetical protein